MGVGLTKNFLNIILSFFYIIFLECSNSDHRKLLKLNVDTNTLCTVTRLYTGLAKLQALPRQPEILVGQLEI